MVNGNGHNRIEIPLVRPDEMVARPPQEYEELLDWIANAVAWLDEIEDEATREQIFAVLDGIDALHRNALARLVERAEEVGGNELLQHLADDEVVALLFDLYDVTEPRE